MTADKAKKETTRKPTKTVKKKLEDKYKDGTFHHIPLREITVTKNIIRHRDVDAAFVNKLALSMVEHGYQSIDVYVEDGLIKISEGFTRFAAVKSLGWSSIQCRIIPKEKAFSNALHKAMMRNDLSPLERAEAFKKHMDASEPKLSIEDLAKEFNKSIGNIRQTLGYLNLPEEIKSLVRGQGLTYRELDTLMELNGKLEEQKAKCDEILAKKAGKTGQGRDDRDENEPIDGDDSLADGNTDSGSTDDGKNAQGGSKKPPERKGPFETLTGRIDDLKTRLAEVFKVEEPTDTKRRGPKKLVLGDEHKAVLQQQFTAKEFEEVLGNLGLKIVIERKYVVPAQPEEKTESPEAPQTTEPDSKPESAAEASAATPETPDLPKDEE